jgi:hypothetical protein
MRRDYSPPGRPNAKFPRRLSALEIGGIGEIGALARGR